jgi:uncharacterized protein YchJ
MPNQTIRISKARKELLAKYATAAVNLYGVITTSELAKVFNHYEDDKTNAEEVKLALMRLPKSDKDYNLYDDILAIWLFEQHFSNFDEAIKGILEQQKSKKRYLPSAKDEFLKFEDYQYIEPRKPYDELREHILKKKLNGGKTGLNGVDGDLISFHREVKYGTMNVKSWLEHFSERGYKIGENGTLKAAQEFMNFLMNAHNNTRLYCNNGFTPSDIPRPQTKNSSEFAIHQPKKPKLSDGCHCGSGKNYRDCCSLLEKSGSAQLSQDECKLFYETWYKLLSYVNKKLNVVKYLIKAKYPSYHDEELLYKVRQRLWQKPKLIGEFAKKRIDFLSDTELELLQSWEKCFVKEQFILMKYEPDYAVLMRMDSGVEPKLYAVKGMTTSIAEAMRTPLPVMLDTVLLPVGGKITYDSFMTSRPLSFGGGVTQMFDEEYDKALKKYGIIESLENSK